MALLESSPERETGSWNRRTSIPSTPPLDRARGGRPFLPGRPHAPLEADAFESLLRKEEARTNRTGSPLSLVVFIEADGSPACGELLRVLADRSRGTDSLGFTRDGRVAVLLLDTNAAGAWAFADASLGRLADDNVRLQCAVYCHPFPGGDAGPDEGEDGERGESAVGHDGAPEAFGSAWPPEASQARDVGDLAQLTSHPLPRWRRGMDIVLSSAALALLSPVFLATALAIKLTSPGPVFFSQPRAGRGGKPFAFYKFRSMYIDAEERKEGLRAQNEASGPIFKIQADPRITPLGRILRRTSIDELPQLWNVLRGDMTLIGPRPPTFDEIPSYEPWQRRRLSATVGLICIREVSGRSEIGFRDWVRMDLRYIDRRSLWLDIQLLFRAVGAVVSRRGAF